MNSIFSFSGVPNRIIHHTKDQYARVFELSRDIKPGAPQTNCKYLMAAAQTAMAHMSSRISMLYLRYIDVTQLDESMPPQ